jgi:hypothetical protein
MEIRKVIQRRIRKSTGGVDFASDVNAVISANVNRGHRPTDAARTQDKRERPDPPPKPEGGTR